RRVHCSSADLGAGVRGPPGRPLLAVAAAAPLVDRFRRDSGGHSAQRRAHRRDRARGVAVRASRREWGNSCGNRVGGIRRRAWCRLGAATGRRLPGRWRGAISAPDGMMSRRLLVVAGLMIVTGGLLRVVAAGDLVPAATALDALP